MHSLEAQVKTEYSRWRTGPRNRAERRAQGRRGGTRPEGFDRATIPGAPRYGRSSGVKSLIINNGART